MQSFLAGSQSLARLPFSTMTPHTKQELIDEIETCQRTLVTAHELITKSEGVTNPNEQESIRETQERLAEYQQQLGKLMRKK